MLFYSVAYAFMNLGAFACVAALQRRPGVTSQITTFSGLGRRAPLLGAADDAVPAVADGHPAAGRLLGQVVRHPGRAAGRRLADAACRARSCINAAVGRVLLPARRRSYMYMRDPAENAPAGQRRWPDSGPAWASPPRHDRDRARSAGDGRAIAMADRLLARCSSATEAAAARAQIAVAPATASQPSATRGSA